MTSVPEWPPIPRQRSPEDMRAWTSADVDDYEDDESPDPVRIGALPPEGRTTS